METGMDAGEAEGAGPGAGKGQVKRQVPAVTRAVAILRQLSRAEEPLGVNEIARRLELVPSTCLHILRALQDEGLAEFEPDTRRWSMGLGILPLARAALTRNSFPALVQPLLANFSDRWGATCIATQLTEPGHMVVVALSQSTQPFRLAVDLGSRFPALISATGRLYAAFGGLPEAQLRAEFAQLQWDAPPGYEAWREEVEAARARGWAVDANTYIAGVTVLAAPMFDSRGRMNRSLVAVGLSARIEAAGIDALAAALIAMRDEAAALFGGGA